MVNYVDHLASLREIGLLVNEPNSINVFVVIEMDEKLFQFLQSSIRFIPRNKTDKFISTRPSKVQVVFRPSTCPRLQSRPVCISEPIHWLQFINYSYQLYKQNQTHISMKKKKKLLGPTCIMKKTQSKIKLFLPTTQEFIVFGNGHTCIISSKFSFMRP